MPNDVHDFSNEPRPQGRQCRRKLSHDHSRTTIELDSWAWDLNCQNIFAIINSIILLADPKLRQQFSNVLVFSRWKWLESKCLHVSCMYNYAVMLHMLWAQVAEELWGKHSNHHLPFSIWSLNPTSGLAYFLFKRRIPSTTWNFFQWVSEGEANV